MSKTLKITLILFVIICSICNFSFATDIDMNIADDDSDFITNETTNFRNNDTTSDETTDTNNGYTTISSVNKTSNDDGLGLGNILNILLIVVGVVLILFAIAILIRLHG